MVFNTTFNNISIISWWLVLLVEETEYPEEVTDLPQVTDKLYWLYWLQSRGLDYFEFYDLFFSSFAIFCFSFWCFVTLMTQTCVLFVIDKW